MLEFINNLFWLTGALVALFFAILVWSAIIIIVVWEIRAARSDYKQYRKQKKQDRDIFEEVEGYRRDVQ